MRSICLLPYSKPLKNMIGASANTQPTFIFGIFLRRVRIFLTFLIEISI